MTNSIQHILRFIAEGEPTPRDAPAYVEAAWLLNRVEATAREVSLREGELLDGGSEQACCRRWRRLARQISMKFRFLIRLRQPERGE